MKRKIAIQGIQGSFHHEAARHLIEGAFDIVPFDSFDEMIYTFSEDNTIHAALMAIENSIVGSILDNYRLLQSKNFRIKSEVYLKINQHLILHKEANMNTITEVYSHPMALKQCEDFLRGYPHIKKVEYFDTAASAERIATKKLLHTAAIASSLAAALFDLKIEHKCIQSNSFNYTRFWLLTKTSEVYFVGNDVNKASIYFHLKNEEGALFKVLSTFQKEKMNITKIQSSPRPEDNWNYYFHLDIEFNRRDDFFRVMTKVKFMVGELTILGVYKGGEVV